MPEISNSLFDITVIRAATESRIAERIYGLYACFVLTLAIVPVLAGLAVVPGIERRRRIARWGARCFFRASGMGLATSGVVLPENETAVVVANHASYLDGMLLTALLPARYTFVIKHEMRRVPVAGFVLRRLGSEFVDRGRHSERRRMARRLLTAARDGKGLGLFPEGTFDANPGLKPFQLGAFSAAWRSDLVVVPTAIGGTRRLLPAHHWLPRPGRLHVHFCEPLRPGDYDSPRTLMAATRQALLERLAEPDLAPADTQPALAEPTDDRARA